MSCCKSLQEISNEGLVRHLIATAHRVERSQYHSSALVDQERLREEVLRRMARTTPMPILDKFLQDMHIMRDELEKEIQDAK